MKQLTCVKWSIVMLPLVVGLTSAAATFTDTHNFGSEGLLWDYESQRWSDNRSVRWTHTLAGFDSSCSITEATLTLEGCGIDNVSWDNGDGSYEKTDYVAVEFMGHDLGVLTGDSTTFNLLPYENLIQSVSDASAEITFQNDLIRLKTRRGDYMIDLDWKDSVYLASSTLSVTCEPPSMVPAPSAVLLAGFGTLLVGLLRQKKNQTEHVS